MDVRRVSIYNSGFNVLCGGNVEGAAYEWRFANGSRIGITNRGFRAAQFHNGENVSAASQMTLSDLPSL